MSERPWLCSVCKFWDGPKLEAKYKDTMGECRRHAPQGTMLDQRAWPLSAWDDWCGEWKDEATKVAL